MAAGPLALHPALRSWYGAGLRYVYFDDEARANLLEQGEERLEPIIPAKKPVTEGSKYVDRTPPQSVEQGATSCRPQRQSYGSSRQMPGQDKAQGHQQGNQASQEAQPVHRTEGPQATNIPPEQWPQAWQDRLTHTMTTAKGAPVLWTYWALGEDVSGAPNAPRRDLLRHILGQLNLPRGTHCFWPIAMPSEEGALEDTPSTGMHLEANAPIFLAGLNILAPRICVIMGSKALKAILPNSTTGPFQQTQCGRMLFFVLPDMDMLLGDPERIPRLVAYLRSALHPFMGRR